MGVGSVESSFLYQTTRCIDSFDHPDLAPIMVFLECLTTLEVSCLGSPGYTPIYDQWWGRGGRGGVRVNHISHKCTTVKWHKHELDSIVFISFGKRNDLTNSYTRRILFCEVSLRCCYQYHGRTLMFSQSISQKALWTVPTRKIHKTKEPTEKTDQEGYLQTKTIINSQKYVVRKFKLFPR